MNAFPRLILLLLSVLSLGVNAALLDRDGYISDTQTGLDWLDLTQTAGLSYQDVSAQLVQGGSLEGWRYASLAEVVGLLDSAGGNGDYNVGWSSANNGIVAPLLTIWGDLRGDFTSSIITGEADPLSLSRLYRVHLSDNPNNRQSANADYTIFSNVPVDTANAIYGSALVRVAAVPLPPALVLFATGVLVLVRAGRRRNT